LNIKKTAWMVGVLLALLVGACAPAATPAVPTPTQPAPAIDTTVPPTPSRLPPSPARRWSRSTWRARRRLGNGLDGWQRAGPRACRAVHHGSPALPDAPQRTVNLDDYWIYKTEVTNSMYAFCVSVGACAPPVQEVGTQLYDNPVYANYPVVGVTWDMAANYCAWIGGSCRPKPSGKKPLADRKAHSFPGETRKQAVTWAISPVVLAGSPTSTNMPKAPARMTCWIWPGTFSSGSMIITQRTTTTARQPRIPIGPESGEFRVVRSSGYESDVSNRPHPLFAARPGPAIIARPGVPLCGAEPPAYAPMCQTSSYVPSAVVSSGECQVPDVNVGASYCEVQPPFHNG
jgi:hypothetical protein